MVQHIHFIKMTHVFKNVGGAGLLALVRLSQVCSAWGRRSPSAQPPELGMAWEPGLGVGVGRGGSPGSERSGTRARAGA